MKIKPKSIFLIIILLLMLFSIGTSISFRRYEAMLAPLLLSITIFILGLIELVREMRTEDKVLQPSEEDEELPPSVVAGAVKGSEMGRFAVALGWIGGFALGIYVIGFFLSILVFAVSYLKVRGRSWLSSAAFAVIFTAVLYAIFAVGFKAQLYRGLVFG
jgi:fatty acid desaturase